MTLNKHTLTSTYEIIKSIGSGPTMVGLDSLSTKNPCQDASKTLLGEIRGLPHPDFPIIQLVNVQHPLVYVSQRTNFITLNTQKIFRKSVKTVTTVVTSNINAQAITEMYSGKNTDIDKQEQIDQKAKT